MKRLAILASVFLPSTAFAAEHLECVESGYSPAQRAAIERQLANFRFNVSEDIAQDFVDAVGDRSQACARTYHWSPQASEQARRYQQTNLLYAATVRHMPFSPAQLGSLRRNYAAAGPWARRVLTELVDAGYAQRPPNVSSEDGQAVVQILNGTGIPTSGPQAQYAGAMTVNMAGIDLARSRFAAL